MKRSYHLGAHGRWTVSLEGADEVCVTDPSGGSVCLPARLLVAAYALARQSPDVPTKLRRGRPRLPEGEHTRREAAAAELMRQGVPRYVAARQCKVPQAQVPRIVAAYGIDDLRKKRI